MLERIKAFFLRSSGHYDKYRGKARNHTSLDMVWKVSILVIGLTVVLVGVLFLVIPGPGWPVIIIGLLVLATEFRWAQRMLEPVQRVSSRFNESYKARTSQRTRAIVLLVVIAISALSLFIAVATFR